MSQTDDPDRPERDRAEPASDTSESMGQTWLPPIVAEPTRTPPAPIEETPGESAAAGTRDRAEPNGAVRSSAVGAAGAPRALGEEPRWPLYVMIGSFAVLVMSVAFWWSSRSSSLSPVPLPQTTTIRSGTPAVVVPTGPPVDSPSAAVPASGYAFLATAADGSPYRWNPCSSIRYAVNLASAPPGALEDVQDAARRVSLATGITFQFAGTSSESVAQRRSNGYVVTGSDGATWAPVLIAWLPAAEFQGLGYDPAASGAGGPFPAGSDVGATTGQYVSGLVALNVGITPVPPSGFATPTSWGVVLMHELGHVVGLGHVADPGQIMNAGLDQPRTATDWGPGDRQGLALVGRQAGCLPAVTPPPA